MLLIYCYNKTAIIITAIIIDCLADAAGANVSVENEVQRLIPASGKVLPGFNHLKSSQ